LVEALISVVRFDEYYTRMENFSPPAVEQGGMSASHREIALTAIYFLAVLLVEAIGATIS
jgi:hypothetical protein